MHADDYLRDVSEEMERAGYTRDCVAHACALADLLRASGRKPWIGRIRDTRGTFHGPLTPQRFLGRGAPTWTTHYVACAEDQVYDPIVGKAMVVTEYGRAVFGRELKVEEFLDAEKTDELLRAGELRSAFRVYH